MKTATIPSLRVDEELRNAAESVLQEGETLSGFVVQSIRESIERRQTQHEFVARGLQARKTARKAGEYVSTNSVVDRLEKMLLRAKTSAKSDAKASARK
jgi:predicted transcriptional regulator